MLHVIPNFAAIAVLEETVDLVVELLQLERSEVLLVKFQQFQPIVVNFSVASGLKFVSVDFCLAVGKNLLFSS